MNYAQRAIIMAAGLGTRMEPITQNVPKPLIKVNGIRMIDTIINALHKNGIFEIYIVVGYLKEQFQELQNAYTGISLIENPYYDTANNISSLYVAREHINNAIIIDGDQIIYNDAILSPSFERSGYCCMWQEDTTSEWLLTLDNDIVSKCSRTGGKAGWQLFGISFWSQEDGERLKQHLELEFKQHNSREIYWDDIALFCHPDEYKLGIREIHHGDVLEIDSYDELCSIDPSYKEDRKPPLRKQIAWNTTLIPLFAILSLFIIFVSCPDASKNVLGNIRNFLGNEMGLYYLVIGLGFFLCSLYIAFSKYGKIKLGNTEKPAHSNFAWGTMIFTSTMAADILFYSLCEWALYAGDPHIDEMGGIQQWASVYPLFHWGPIPWSFYIVLAVAFGFMLHVRGRSRQKFSEACRPILKNKTDGFLGTLIDLLAVFALLAGTATTFSLATPLLAEALGHVFNFTAGTTAAICILILIAVVYTLTVLFGMKGITKLASFCVYLFFTLLLYFLIGGGETQYILETGFSALGTMTQNFFTLSTWSDPLRNSTFAQDWTIYYWAYWMVWCVATPFFIGTISKGRTIKNTIIGGYTWGLAGTFTSFIILGNYGLAKQVKGELDIVSFLNDGGSLPEAIIKIFDTLPLPYLGLILLAVTMIAFYSTTFDALTMVVSSYSYKTLDTAAEPDKRIRTYWAILFIMLPIALIFSESSMANLQSVSIIAAFPVGIIIILIVASFFKDANQYISEKGSDK